MRAWIALALSLSAAACGTPGDDAGCCDSEDHWPPDAAKADASATCGTSGTTWRLEPRDATSLALLGQAPLDGGRTARFLVGVHLGPCEEIAMPQVGFTLEGTNAIIYLYAWVPQGADCTAGPQDLLRPVSIKLPEALDWQVTASGTTDVVHVAVAADPATCDPTRTPCLTDCDCTGEGEKCLSIDGVAPTTQCARPCEVDRDCDGGTCDPGAPDGMLWSCTADPECGICPVGWSCSAGTCTPDFVLDSSTRHECACDADCDPGLRCVEPYNPADSPRCQAVCETGGNWCQGPHVCGSLGQDVSGLAGTDSVCGWVGE